MSARQFSRFVDGGVVGPPVQSAGSTRLYPSGDDADAVAELWIGTALETRIVQGDGGVGAASAVKACFAAHGLPDGFGTAAADVYARMAGFKDTTGTTLDEVIAALRA